MDDFQPLFFNGGVEPVEPLLCEESVQTALLELQPVPAMDILCTRVGAPGWRLLMCRQPPKHRKTSEKYMEKCKKRDPSEFGVSAGWTVVGNLVFAVAVRASCQVVLYLAEIEEMWNSPMPSSDPEAWVAHRVHLSKSIHARKWCTMVQISDVEWFKKQNLDPGPECMIFQPIFESSLSYRSTDGVCRRLRSPWLWSTPAVDWDLHGTGRLDRSLKCTPWVLDVLTWPHQVHERSICFTLPEDSRSVHQNFSWEWASLRLNITSCQLGMVPTEVLSKAGRQGDALGDLKFPEVPLNCWKVLSEFLSNDREGRVPRNRGWSNRCWFWWFGSSMKWTLFILDDFRFLRFQLIFSNLRLDLFTQVRSCLRWLDMTL